MIQRFAWARSGSTLGLTLAPYLILLSLVLLTCVLWWFDPLVAHLVWSSLRWLIRLSFIGGAYWGWRVTERGQRPLWWYSWLGFATYELVGLLLIGGVFDVALNVLSSLILLDAPFQRAGGHREITFSQRLKRLQFDDGWRGDVSRWIAATFILWIDPDHLS